MSSDLLVPVLGCSSLLKVESFENGIPAELLLDSQQCFLHLTLLGECCLLFLSLSLKLLIVREEVVLYRLYMLLGILFANDMISGDVEPSDEIVSGS